MWATRVASPAGDQGPSGPHASMACSGRSPPHPRASTSLPLLLQERLQHIPQVRLAYLLQLVAHPHRRLPDPDQAAQVDRRADDDRVARHSVDGRLEILHLPDPVAHGGQQGADLRVPLECVADRPRRPRSRVDDFRRAELVGHHARAELHLAVRQRRAVLDDEHPLAGDAPGVIHDDRRRGVDDGRPAVHPADVLPQRVDGVDVGGVHLVDDHHVREPQVGLARVVQQLVADAQRIGDDDVQVRCIEGRVVVPAVPEDDIGLGLGLRQDVAVVDARVDDRAADDVRFVLLDFLDRALVLLEVGNRREALDPLLLQVAIGHRVPDGGDLQAVLLEDAGDAPGGLALAGAGADGADRDHRLGAHEHRVGGGQQLEAGPGRVDDRPARHHVGVGHVAVRKDDLVDFLLADDGLEVLLGEDRYPPGVVRAGERRRIAPAVDVRNLGGGEGDDLVPVIVAVDDVEVVEVAPGGAHDDGAYALHAASPVAASLR